MAVQGVTVAVVIPAHNEADHVGGVVAAIPSWVDRIIVVDDASTDETSAVVGATRDDRVLLLRHADNAGVGAAMKTGYRAAIDGGYDLVAKIDADGQMNVAELSRLVEPIQLDLADYVKGNRFYLRARADAMPTQRRFGNTALSFMTKTASGYWHVYDSQCGYTVVRSSFLRLIDLDAIPDDYFFENAMLIQLSTLNARVVDVPTSTAYGEEVSGVSIPRAFFTFPPRLFVSGVKGFWRKHLVTDFDAIGVMTMVGAALSLFGVVFGEYRWWLSIATGRVASTGTVMLAVLPLVVGVQLMVQAFALGVQSSPGAAETASFAHTLISRGDLSE